MEQIARKHPNAPTAHIQNLSILLNNREAHVTGQRALRYFANGDPRNRHSKGVTLSSLELSSRQLWFLQNLSWPLKRVRSSLLTNFLLPTVLLQQISYSLLCCCNRFPELWSPWGPTFLSRFILEAFFPSRQDLSSDGRWQEFVCSYKLYAHA